jgi:hypothetical protein
LEKGKEKKTTKNEQKDTPVFEEPIPKQVCEISHSSIK